MTDNNPNPDAAAGAAQDGNNANQGGGNSQGQGGNQNQNQGGDKGNQGANQGAGDGGNQAGADDYKTKFSESSKEANRLLDVLKANGIDPKTGKKADSGDNNGGNANQGNNDGAGELPFFTDQDLEAAFPSFVAMSDEEKALLRQVGSFPKMARMVAEMYDKSTFTEQLEVLKADPANKIIADNEKEFKAYAYKDGNLKLPMDVLVNAFIGMKLRDGSGNNGGGNGNNQNQGDGASQRSGMEQGTGGQGGDGDAVTEMTPDQARDLRTKDPRKYNALARTGKLKIVTGN